MERTNWDSLRGTWKAVLSHSFVLLLEGSGLSGSCSVAKLYPTCCDPMDCSTPGFPVLPHLLEFAQTHLHWVDDAIQHLILCCPLLLLSSIFSNIRVFSMSRLFTSGGWSIGASASASVLPMTTQDWFPLGLTGLISFLSRDSQKSSPAPQFESINSLALSLLYYPTLTSICDYWKIHSFDYMDFGGKVMSLLFNTLSRFVIAFLPRSEYL